MFHRVARLEPERFALVVAIAEYCGDADQDLLFFDQKTDLVADVNRILEFTTCP